MSHGRRAQDRTATAQEPADPPYLRLALSGWRVRIRPANLGRPALEVYAGERLMDVSVATPLSTALLRAAWRGHRKHPWALAWGQVPPDAGEITVEFGARRGTGHHAGALILAGAYWIAESPATSTTVTVRAGRDRSTLRTRRAPALA